MGVRGDALFWLVCLGCLPVSVVLLTITLRLFPPDAELTGEFRGILYGKPDQPSDSAGDPAEDDETTHIKD